MNILFVTWDGPQVTYLESLFLPIFKSLSEKYNINFHVLQFSWGGSDKIRHTKDICALSGVSYRHIKVARANVAIGSMLTAFYGSRVIKKLVKNLNIDLIMPRSTLPALATLHALKDLTVPIVFDADGLPLDERVDFNGQNPSSLSQRFLRDIESQILRKADIVLTRTYKAQAILKARAGAGTLETKFYKVSNGRDENIFYPRDIINKNKIRNSLNVGEDEILLVYAGSMGEQYCINEVFHLLEKLTKYNSKSHLLIMTGSTIEAKKLLSQYNHLNDNVTITTVLPSDVPLYLSASDIGIAFRKASFSMQGVSPIKIGEYLLSGLPVVISTGIGDDKIIDDRVGYNLSSFSSDELDSVAHWIISNVKKPRENKQLLCYNYGKEHYSLASSCNLYAHALGIVKK